MRSDTAPELTASIIESCWSRLYSIALEHNINRSYTPIAINIDEASVWHESKDDRMIAPRGGKQPVRPCARHVRECCTAVLTIVHPAGIFPTFVLFKGDNWVSLPQLNSQRDGKRPSKPSPPPHVQRLQMMNHPLTTEMFSAY